MCYRRRRTVEGRLQNPEEVDRVEDRSNRVSARPVSQVHLRLSVGFLGRPAVSRTYQAMGSGARQQQREPTKHRPLEGRHREAQPWAHEHQAYQPVDPRLARQPECERPTRRATEQQHTAAEEEAVGMRAVAASCRVPRHVVRWKHAVLQCMWRDARCNLARGVMRGEAWTGCARCNALCAMDDVLHGVYIKGDLCDAVRGCDVAWTHGVTHDVTHRV